MGTSRFHRVGLFVDWNSQLRECPSELKERPIDLCQLALRRVGKVASKLLCAVDGTSVFQVRTRLYHGWTAGVTQTPNRRAFLRIPEASDPDSIFPSERVLALGDVEFGDRLIDALPDRENVGLRIHLPNTLRRATGSVESSEKMVDTAMAVDILAWARQEPQSIALIFSSDDDIVPPTFVAEAWMKPLGGSVHLVRPPARGDSRFLRLDGLLNWSPDR